MTSFFHYTSLKAFASLTSHPGAWLASWNLDYDASYGPGWYVTTLRPDTATARLVDELWGGNSASQRKTECWLEILIEGNYRPYLIPDSRRPDVIFVPYYNVRKHPDSEAIMGCHGTIKLVRGGTRMEISENVAEVKVLLEPDTEFELLPARMFYLYPGADPLYRYRLKLDNPESFVEEDDLECELVTETDVLYRQGRFEEALSVSSKLVSRFPESALGWTNRGAILAALGRRGDAIHCYDRALAFSPEHIQALTNKAASLITLGRHVEAIGCCDQALAIDQRCSAALNNKGDALVALEREDEACVCFELATSAAPELHQAWNGFGGVLCGRAIRNLRENSNLRSGFLTLMSSGECFLKAIELCGSYQNARTNLETVVRLVLAGLPHSYPCEAFIFKAAKSDKQIFGQFCQRLFDRHVPKMHPKYVAEINESGILSNCGFASIGELTNQTIETAMTATDAELTSAMGAPLVRMCLYLFIECLINAGLVDFPFRVTSSRMEARDLSNGERLQIAKTLNDSGVMCRQVGELERARECYLRALVLYEASGDRKFCAHVHYNLGVVYQTRNGSRDEQLAEDAFRHAFATYSELGLSEDLEATRGRLANLLDKKTI